MREIEFRGMSINGNWYYGLLSESQGVKTQPSKGFYICNSCGMPWAYQVRPETIGQYTGLKDKNGKNIYEGDIIKIKWNNIDTSIETVTYSQSEFGFNYGNNSLYEIKDKEIEVIGNIYENKGVLK